MELLDEDDLLELLRKQFLADPTRSDVVLRACQKVVGSGGVQVPRDRFWMKLGLKFFPNNETTKKLERMVTNLDAPSVRLGKSDVENETFYADLSKRIQALVISQNAMEQLVKQNEEIIAELRRQRRELFPAAADSVDDGSEDIRGLFDELRSDLRRIGLQRKEHLSEVPSGFKESQAAFDCATAQEEAGQIDGDKNSARSVQPETFSVLFTECQVKSLGPNLVNALCEIVPLSEYNYAEGPVGPLRRARRRSTRF